MAACGLTAAACATTPQAAGDGRERAAVQTLAARALAERDARGLPFAVVDKEAATMWVYRADGRLAGATPVLIGQARGDHIAPGTGEQTEAGRLRGSDRTTPAGRFVSEPGRHSSGEAIVWLDYRSALAIHRLRPGPSHRLRQARLASPLPAGRRVSAGCVVVPEAFYDEVVQPLLGRSRGVVYVVPENGDWRAFWQDRGRGRELDL